MKSKAITTIMLTLFLASMLSMAFNIAPVHATKPISVSGIWSWTVPIVYGIREAGGNIFISAVESDTFTGDFEGTGYGDFKVVDHTRKGFMTGDGRTLFTGTVQGKSGTLVIQWAGNTKNDLGYWWFEWIILRGTGDLANLRGQGTAWGPGPAGVAYSGTIHFDPD